MIGKCNNGYQIGYDFCLYDECLKECETKIFNSCRSYRKGCIGKADFGSYTIAKMKAVELSDDNNEYGPYKCYFCSGWHIGSIY